MSFSGYTNAGVQLGLQTLIMKPVKRGFDNIMLSDGTVVEDAFKVIVDGLLKADITIEEVHTDEMEITEHPIQQGASIADHAFKRPAEVVLKLGWSNSPVKSSSLVNAALGAAATASPIGNALAGVVGAVQAGVGFYNQYQQNQGQALTPSNQAYEILLFLQSERAIFDIYTGRRKYLSMIIKSLAAANDWRTENSLFITVTCKQVILVNTSIVSLPSANQANPQATQSPAQKGTIAPKIVSVS